MAFSIERLNRRRLRTSYISVIISLSLVLFTLGLLGLLILNAKHLSDQVREDFAMTLILDPDAKEVEVREFQKGLEVAEYVKGTEYISKEEAAEDLANELDENFVEFLGFNPLSDAIEVHFRADYTHPDSLSLVETELRKQGVIKDVVYDKPLLEMMNENIRKISIGILGVSLLLVIIAFGLINSSIRLAIYSKRFLIKTMQLVGATKRFIRKPFLGRSVRHGFISAVVAVGLIYGMLQLVETNFPEVAVLKDYKIMGIMAGGLVVAGIFISYFCTFLAVKRYLNLRTDQLY